MKIFSVYAERNRKVAQARSRNVLKRFLIKVEKGDGCWLWQGSRWNNGYGRIQYHGRRQKAHRVAYELFVAPIPKGMCVCHHCDNPPCVRPDHLFLGTQSDNQRDAFSKGRRISPSTRPEIAQKIAATKCGRPLSIKHRAAISAARRGSIGKPHSIETRKKIRIAALRRWERYREDRLLA